MLQTSRELLPVPVPWGDATENEVTVSVTTDHEPGAFYPVESVVDGVAQVYVGPGTDLGTASAGLNRVYGNRDGDIKYLKSIWVEGGTSTDPDDIDGGGASTENFDGDINGGTA